MEIDFKKIEQKWQKKWEEKKIFEVKENSKKKKFYVLEMFPYPSGSGLHMGHAWNYTIGDILARFKIMQEFNVLHPMGYDSLGLPAENAAIKVGEHPEIYTKKSIANFIKQQKELGLSYDWTRILSSADSKYYKWDQWIFLKMLEKGLAYQKEASVNWCPKCKSVLANEQVHDGKCWRHEDTNVEIKILKQWFLKITDYAEELYDELDKLVDWPERTKAMQKNWIGKSEGVNVFWKVKNMNETLKTFTTTVDTLFGVTFIVISPEHPLLQQLITNNQRKKVEKYLNEIKNKNDLERTELNKNKNGVFVGSYLINPLTKEEIPIFVADYVLMTYGTGVVMGVPAHDRRDKDFAEKYKLFQKQVLELNGKSFVYDDVDKYNVKGFLINSGKFDGLSVLDGREAITKELEKIKMVKRTIQYKLKDWGVSRQRYWGTPIPIIHCAKCKKDAEENSLTLNFYNQETFSKIKDGSKTIETRALNPEEKDRYFGNVKKGDYLKFLNKETNEIIYVGVENVKQYKNLNELLKDKESLKQISPGKEFNSILDLEKGYNFTEGYVDKINKNGLVAWKIKKIVPGIVPVPEKDLPVVLPTDVKFGKGNPLETNEKWLNVKCPRCGGKGKREAETMDTFVNSSWYFLRYCDPKNDKEIFDKKKVEYWCPINVYIGGAEHACMHLIYFRFYTKFLRDIGMLRFGEPAEKMFHQGMLHAEGGAKMSKSKPETCVLPEDVSEKYGMDTARFFLCGLASPDKDIDWSEAGIVGSLRFVNKIFDFVERIKFEKTSEKVQNKLNQTIKNITHYYENFEYRKASIEIRELFEIISGEKISKDDFGKFLKLLNPICPHITEEFWEKIGNPNFISNSEWPKYEEKTEKKISEIDLNKKYADYIWGIVSKIEVKGEKVKKIFVYAVPFEFAKVDAKKIEKILGKKIEIFSVADSKKIDPEGKSKKAIPGMPGVYIE